LEGRLNRIGKELGTFSISADNKGEIEQSTISQDLTLPEIQSISASPFTMDNTSKGKCFLLVLNWVEKYGRYAAETYFVHNLLWQLFSDSSKNWLSEYDCETRQIAWKQTKSLYENVLLMHDDPAWVDGRQAIMRRILNGCDCEDGEQV